MPSQLMSILYLQSVKMLTWGQILRFTRIEREVYLCELLNAEMREKVWI